MLTLDGSSAGGQVLRSALALSATTGQAFTMTSIRGRRRRPGLMRQHLTAVRAAAAVCGAEVVGAELRSTVLRFTPGPLRAGEFRFDIGTAGSTTLVLQTVLPPLLCAPGPSTVTLRGGTHNPLAPSADFLRRSFVPLVQRMGPTVDVELVRHGFAPAGGGELVARVVPAPLTPWALGDVGPIRSCTARVLVANLPPHVGRREVLALQRALPRLDAAVVEPVDADGPGNAVVVEVQTDQLTAVFDAVGQRGVRAERVAADLAARVKAWMSARVPVEEHLQDQLLLLMTLAGGGRFRTVAASEHTRSNLEVLRAFLPERAPQIVVRDGVTDIA